jgi:DNA-binding MarR family transcriptional regulator
MQRLVKKGFIDKQQDKDDRRNWWLSLTSEGSETAKNVINGAADYTSDFLSCLSPEEQSVLHSLILRISHSLGYDWQ